MTGEPYNWGGLGGEVWDCSDLIAGFMEAVQDDGD